MTQKQKAAIDALKLAIDNAYIAGLNLFFDPEIGQLAVSDVSNIEDVLIGEEGDEDEGYIEYPEYYDGESICDLEMVPDLDDEPVFVKFKSDAEVQ